MNKPPLLGKSQLLAELETACCEYIHPIVC